MNRGAQRGRKSLVSLLLIWLAWSIVEGSFWPHSPDAQQTDSLVYKPPQRGAPGGREGAGARGSGETLPTLVVLSPRDHTGLTIQEQPVLYWYVSQETKHPVEVTLTDRQSVKPLLERRLEPPLQPGFHHLRLAEYAIRLTPGVPYKWSVALILSPHERSQDIVSAGTIERISPSDELRNQLARASKATTAHLYAEAGLWYDTMAALSALIEAAPGEAIFRQQRAALLEQQSLPEAADYDRQRQSK